MALKWEVQLCPASRNVKENELDLVLSWIRAPFESVRRARLQNSRQDAREEGKYRVRSYTVTRILQYIRRYYRDTLHSVGDGFLRVLCGI